VTPYVEPGGSWRAFWLVAGVVAGVVAVLVVLGAALPGPELPSVAWAGAAGVVLGMGLAGTVSARRAWTVRVDGDGLAVGRERVAFPDIDAGHLRDGAGGVDAGAPVLGGGWSLPRGRTGLPLRLTDGRTVLVPTRDPAALRTAVLRWRGTLGS
jgi:hypothetical protein